MCFAPQRGAHFEHLKVQKWSEHAVLSIWTLKRASRHNGTHFFIKCSETVIFNVFHVTTACTLQHLSFQKWCFDIQTCFVPQWRALFQQLDVQSAPTLWSFVHFDFETPHALHFFNVSTFKNAPRMVYFIDILISTCASCRIGVQFFISHLARWLRARRFGEPSSRPPGATYLKNTVFRDFFFLTFSCLHLLSSDSFSSLICFLLVSSLTFPTSASALSIRPEVGLPNFLLDFAFSYEP